MFSTLCVSIFLLAFSVDQNEPEIVGVRGTISEACQYKWKFDNSQGMIVTVKLDPKEFSSGTPKRLNLHLQLDNQSKKSWEILRVDGWIGDPVDKKEIDPGPSLNQSDKDFADRVSVVRGLEKDTDYTFEIYLHRKNKKHPRVIQSEIEDIIHGQSFRATYLYKR